ALGLKINRVFNPETLGGLGRVGTANSRSFAWRPPVCPGRCWACKISHCVTENLLQRRAECRYGVRHDASHPCAYGSHGGGKDCALPAVGGGQLRRDRVM